MVSKSLLAVFLIGVPSALATIHTECYNYFMKKDGCIHAAADDRNRCPLHPHPAPVDSATVIKPLSKKPPHGHGKGNRLQRRYATDGDSYTIAGGTGNCGHYDTNDQKHLGICLWAGSNSDDGGDPRTAGWLNYAKTSNCGKRVWIQRKGSTKSIYAKVVDSCTFGTEDLTDGCFRIAFTNATFHALHPTPDEINHSRLNGVNWDFDNPDGKATTQGPV